MLLAIDIGNSNIALGGFSEEKLCFVARISTDVSKTSDEYASILLNTLSLYQISPNAVRGAIVSSVVPALNRAIKEAVKLICGIESLLVGPGIKTGLGLHCDDPASVGADLVCACVAARAIYGKPVLIIDMGTATKMTVVDQSGAFAGVSIIPGVNMGLKALTEGTAQLPQVSLEEPKTVIGKNTVECMRSGIIYGNASLIDGMIDRFNEELGANLPIVATGGLANTIIKHCKHCITVDETLVLKGLNIIYNKNN
jgi:type III pantothenate kinase